MANNIIKLRNKDGSDSQESEELKKDMDEFFSLAEEIRLDSLRTAKTRIALETTVTGL